MFKPLLVSALAFAVSVSYAQDNSTTEAIIRQLEQKAAKGILDADSNILKQVWAPEFIVNTPRNEIAENRAAVFNLIKRGFINYSAFDRIIESIQISGSIAMTMGYETYIPKVDLPEAKAGQLVKRRFTNIWLLQNDKWLQIGRHASIICQ